MQCGTKTTGQDVVQGDPYDRLQQGQREYGITVGIIGEKCAGGRADPKIAESGGAEGFRTGCGQHRCPERADGSF